MSNTNNKIKIWLIGLILIALGGLILASNLELISWNAKQYIFTWPTLLIVIGLISFTKREGIPMGIILILVGGFFHVRKYIDMPFNFHQVFWPSLIILIGILILLSRVLFKPRVYSSDGEPLPPESDEEVIDDVAIFGGVERTITTKNFRGGKSISIFGGSKLNLLNTKLAQGIHILEIVAIFGGSQYIIPSDWNIKINVFTIFGGFTDKRYITSDGVDSSKQLVIRGIAIFGGGEIRSA